MIDRQQQYGDLSEGFGAVCAFCGSYYIFIADPMHKRVVKSGYRDRNNRWHSFDTWEMEPVSDGRARIEALDLEGSRYVPPKPCERCRADGPQPYHERRGVPGLGTAEGGIVIENG